MTRRKDAVAPTDTTEELALAAAEREERRLARTRGLDELLARRPDLAGVHDRADWAHEALRWTA